MSEVVPLTKRFQDGVEVQVCPYVPPKDKDLTASPGVGHSYATFGVAYVGGTRYAYLSAEGIRVGPGPIVR